MIPANPTDTALRFRLTPNRGGMFYQPANAAAEAVIPKGRKCLKPFEVCNLLDAGRIVQVDLNPYLGVQRWVALTASVTP